MIFKSYNFCQNETKICDNCLHVSVSFGNFWWFTWFLSFFQNINICKIKVKIWHHEKNILYTEWNQYNTCLEFGTVWPSDPAVWGIALVGNIKHSEAGTPFLLESYVRYLCLVLFFIIIEIVNSEGRFDINREFPRWFFAEGNLLLP